jgi:hypothetical protein
VHDHLPGYERQATLLRASTAHGHLCPRLAVDKGARIGRIPQDGNDSRLERAVGIFDDASIFLAQQAGRESQGQVASLGLLLHACNQAAAQGVELDFAHDALHPEQQTAIGGRSIVDAIAVRNQTLIIRTQIEQGRPIGAVAG